MLGIVHCPIQIPIAQSVAILFGVIKPPFHVTHRFVLKMVPEMLPYEVCAQFSLSLSNAIGYKAHSGDGNDQEIVVMKIPSEDENVLHTLIHEMSHARLDHLNRKDIPYGIGETEAELCTYLVGQHC